MWVCGIIVLNPMLSCHLSFWKILFIHPKTALNTNPENTEFDSVQFLKSANKIYMEEDPFKTETEI